MNKIVSYLMSILIICALAFIFYWFLIHEPYNTKMSDYATRIDDSKALIKKYKRAQEENKQIESSINETKQKIFKLLCTAKGRTLEDFLKELEDDSQGADIDLENVRIENVHIDELSSKIPIDLNVGGPYFKIFKFISLIEEKGKLDFASGGSLNVASDNKENTIKDLRKYTDLSRKKYMDNDKFPGLRVNLNGEIIIIDDNHMRKYRTSELSSCEGL